MRSFFYGIIITSILWLLALYLIFPGDFWTSSLGDTTHGGHNLNPRLMRRHHQSQHHAYHSVISSPLDSRSPSHNHHGISHGKINGDGKIDWLYEFNTTLPDNLGHVISKSRHDQLTQRLSSIRSRPDQRLKLAGYKKFAFNLLTSNRLGLFRPLPDTRSELCKDIKFKDDKLLPAASIIICYYNEAPSALMRTVYSVLERTQGRILEEVILVDDCSDDELTITNITEYIRSPLIKMLRTPERAGLVRARLFGSRQAKGDVLVFLDSHVEPNEDWLRPLLQEVSTNNNTIACPMIDVINPNTLQYSASPMVRGGVNWGLHFKWDSIGSDLLKTKEDFIKPILSPTMAGGLFAVSRQYFTQIGEYDDGMNIWGGENIELSFRTWMCGGQIKILPCSKVGHVFRHRRPYGSEDGEDTLVYNSLRAALVWLDEYKEKFYKAHPVSRNMNVGDVSDRISIRQKLQCKNFTWYLDTIYPMLKQEAKDETRLDNKWQMLREKYGRMSQRKDVQGLAPLQYGLNKKWPKQLMLSESLDMDQPQYRMPKVIMRYQIQLSNSNLCIESKDGPLHKGSGLILNHCAKSSTNIGPGHMNNQGNQQASYDQIDSQVWSETEKKDLRLSDLLCLDAVKNLPVLRKCHNLGSFQEWTHSNGVRGISIYNAAGGLCLGVERGQVGEPLLVNICENNYDDILDNGAKSRSSIPWVSITNQKWNLLIENPNQSHHRKSSEKLKYSKSEIYNLL